MVNGKVRKGISTLKEVTMKKQNPSKTIGKKNALQLSHRIWLSKAREYAVKHADKHGFVTSDDVVERIGVCQSPSVAGAIFRDSRFTKSGYIPSRRKTTHAREITVWRLKPYDPTK